MILLHFCINAEDGTILVHVAMRCPTLASSADPYTSCNFMHNNYVKFYNVEIVFSFTINKWSDSRFILTDRHNSEGLFHQVKVNTLLKITKFFQFAKFFQFQNCLSHNFQWLLLLYSSWNLNTSSLCNAWWTGLDNPLPQMLSSVDSRISKELYFNNLHTPSKQQYCPPFPFV